MVLEAGGPCIAIKKMKDSEGNPTTGVCNKTQAHVWYGQKTKCKGCYEVAARLGKRKMETALGTAVAVDLEDLQDESQGVLVKIEDIYGVRYGQSSNARPSARPVPPPPRSSAVPRPP